jgi:hypothetical protein
MAHFAKLNENNEVIAIHVVNNEVLIVDGIELEQAGIDFLTTLHNHNFWKQTSYSSAFRFNFAGIGYTYDPIDDAFIAPAPCEHSELILNENKQWECGNAEHDLP